MKEYEQRFGKNLDEDVKIGDILVLAPPQVQNQYHTNSHILKSYGGSGRCCSTTAEHKRALPLVMLYPWTSLCWVEARKKERRQEGQRQRQKAKCKGKKGQGESSEDGKTEAKASRAKAKSTPKQLSTSQDTAFSAKPGTT